MCTTWALVSCVCVCVWLCNILITGSYSDDDYNWNPQRPTETVGNSSAYMVFYARHMGDLMWLWMDGLEWVDGMRSSLCEPLTY